MGALSLTHYQGLNIIDLEEDVHELEKDIHFDMLDYLLVSTVLLGYDYCV